MATADYVDSKRSTRRRSSGRRKKKSHAFRNMFLVVLCLLMVGVYFAPAIIAGTSLKNWLLQTVVAPRGTIRLGSASLNWFSPVAATNLEVRDASGDTTITVESFRSEKSLIAMLLDVDDLGTLHVVRPAVHLVAYEKDTNLERVFASLLASEGESSVTARLEVTEGTLVLDDTVTHRQFKASNLAIDFALGDATEGIVLAASGALSTQQETGNFKIDLRATPSATTGAALAAGKIRCQTDGLPLELLDPLLRRTIEHAQLSGRLTADLNGAWGPMATDGEASLDGEVTLDQLAFAADVLGADQIRLARVNIPCRIRQKGDLVEIDELAIDCELGQIALSGSAKTSDFAADDVLAALARENYELKGNVDLAILAKMLPNSLRIREGTEITSGRIQLVASSRHQPSGMSWTGLLETSQLAATASGRPFAWDNPLAVQFALHEDQNGIVIDRAVCTSSFLQVNAAGSLNDMTASADFDLAQLVAELRQFSDLNDVQLAGQGRARMTLKRFGQDRLSADVDFQARGFQWIMPDARPWKEDNLVVRLTLDAQMEGTALTRVDAAKLTVTSGSDRFEAQLREAIADPAGAPWPITCSWRGQLAPWVPRLESCLGVTGWDLGGSGTLQATLSASSTAVNVENARIDLAQLQVRGPAWFIQEPLVSSTLKGRWDIDANRVDLTAATISAGTAIAVVDQAVLQATETGWTLDGGNAHLEAELAQLLAWRQDPRTPPSLHVSGRLKGDAKLKHADGATSGQLDAVIDNLQIVDAARPATPATAPATWRERRLTLAARGNYRHADEQLRLDTLHVASDALRLDASGTVATGTGGGNVDVKGTVAYDWSQLAPLWRPYLGQGFQIAGRQTRQFALGGQLTGSPTSADSWKNVGGQAAMGWTAINAYGFRVGQGDITARLADGQLSTQPIDVEISEGRLTISPVARLTPSPIELFLPSGPLLTGVRLSPEICAQGLRFVTPLLADATVAEGRFSISLDGGRLPLSDLGAGDFGGRIAMKGQIKPGPIAAEFVGIIKELVTILRQGKLPNLGQLDGSLMSIDSPNIEFRMVNRRIYHRGLTLIVGTTPVTTEGSVGLDESLSLVAEVPINARLLGQDLSLGALEGRVLKIPIGGTLSKPKLDRRALAEIPLQLIEDTARDVLIDGLNKGLERLFPRQP